MIEREPIGPNVELEDLNKRWPVGSFDGIDNGITVEYFEETMPGRTPVLRPDNYWRGHQFSSQPTYAEHHLLSSSAAATHHIEGGGMLGVEAGLSQSAAAMQSEQKDKSLLETSDHSIGKDDAWDCPESDEEHITEQPGNGNFSCATINWAALIGENECREWKEER